MLKIYINHSKTSLGDNNLTINKEPSLQMTIFFLSFSIDCKP